MKANKKIPHLKGRNFNGRPYPKIRRIREEPRQKIRQLLRSFTLPNQQEKEAKTGQKALL